MYHGISTKFIGMLIFLGSLILTHLFLSQRVQAQNPTPFLVSPYYGEETIGQGYSASHPAIDFDSLDYERVLAAEGGTIGDVRWYTSWYNNNCHHWYQEGQPDIYNCGYGLYTRIDHPNGYRTYYAHLSAAAFDLGTTGVPVHQGQVIATSGHTGWSSGPHLHFEVRDPNNNRVDPFNPNLWEDGQWANPSRPIPAPADGTTIIVDDQGPGFTKSSGWSEAAAGYNNHMWWTNVNLTGDRWARWNPSIPQQGLYEVWVHIPNVNATTWQARYTITHLGGPSTGVVDQTGLNNQWVSIGVYRFRQGTADNVYITNNTGEGYRVHCYDATGSAWGQDWCRLGADAVKFVRRAPTYLPDVRVNSGGWNSSIIVRNNGGNAVVEVKFYDNTGWLATRENLDLAGRGIWIIPLPALSNFTGAAVVDASQDVVIAVENRHSSTDLSYGYDGMAAQGGLGNAGFGVAGSKAFLPLIMDSYYGWYTAFTVLNTGSVTATLTIKYYNPSGGTVFTQNVNLAANGTLSRDQTNMSQLSDNILYAALVEATNGQPIAAVVRQRNSASTSFLAYNGFSSGGSPGYTPALMKNYYGWNSSLTVQNVGDLSANITVTYYTITGTVTEGVSNVPSRASRVFYQPNNPQLPSGNQYGLFAAIVTSSSQPVAIAVNQTLTGTVQALSYAGFVSGSQRSVQPVVMKNYGDGDGTWVTSVTVQNVGISATNMTVTYNDSDATETRSNVPVGRSEVFYQPNNNNLPASYRDWAEVTSSGQPVVAVVNASVPGPTADLAWSYNGFNR